MWSISTSPQIQQVNTPIFFTLNEFTEKSLQSFNKSILKASEACQPIIPISIQSDGGSAVILYGFMSAMESARKNGIQFASVVAGTAASAAACVFLFSDYRYMGEFSSLCYHSLQISQEGALPILEGQMTWYRKENDRINEVISRHLKKPKDWLKKQLKTQFSDDWMISAEDAISNGMATEIRIPQFNLEIKSEFSIS